MQLAKMSFDEILDLTADAFVILTRIISTFLYFLFFRDDRRKPIIYLFIYLFFVKLIINNHVVGLAHKNHIINEI